MQLDKSSHKTIETRGNEGVRKVGVTYTSGSRKGFMEEERLDLNL